MARSFKRVSPGDDVTSSSGVSTLEERILEQPPLEQEETTPVRIIVIFWILGLVNNASYVIMNASAKSISNGGVALVYMAGEFPGVLIKCSSPFWFDKVGYKFRLSLAFVLMVLAFLLAGPIGAGQLGIQLLGVACCSAQSGLGEACFLALASRYPRKGADAVAGWSSGTGFAGVFGYAWVVGLSFVGLAEVGIQTVALFTLPLAFFVTFFALLSVAPPKPIVGSKPSNELHSVCDDDEESSSSERTSREVEEPLILGQQQRKRRRADALPAEVTLSNLERLKFALSLWPVVGAIFTVYFSEYAMQSGVWAAMGFPVSKKNARDTFYETANWLYQGGVLVSRSLGLFFDGTVSKRTLWTFSGTQCILLAFFALDAAHHFWYDESLYALCFIVGLLGGSVYIFGFRRIAADAPAQLRETAMTVGTFFGDAGTALSEVVGLFLQACLYERNHIHGATVSMHLCSPRG